MVRRFDNDEGASEMYECDDGTFVMHDDHITVVEKLKAEITSLREALAEYEDDSSVFLVDLGDEDRRPYSVEDD